MTKPEQADRLRARLLAVGVSETLAERICRAVEFGDFVYEPDASVITTGQTVLEFISNPDAPGGPIPGQQTE